MGTTTAEVNSRAWWEDFFVHHWEANFGKEQTRHFMEALVNNLPGTISSWLADSSLDVLDWGCALGQGVEVLGGLCRSSRITGLDCSAEAIGKAQNLYPQFEWCCSESGAIPRMFDVVVCSNCLEHFDDPFAQLALQLESTRYLSMVLVPFNENPLCVYHRFRFVEGSFPESIGSHRRLVEAVIDVNQAYWPGEQLLVVYASTANSWGSEPGSPSIYDELAQAIPRELRQQSAFDKYRKLHQMHQTLREQHRALQEQHQTFREQMLQEVETAIRERDDLHGHLQAVHSGRAWRLVQFLASLRARLLPPGTWRRQMEQRVRKLFQGKRKKSSLLKEPSRRV